MGVLDTIKGLIKPKDIEKIEDLDKWYGVNMQNRYLKCKIKWNSSEKKLWIYRYNDRIDKNDKSDLLTFPRNPTPSIALQIPVIIHYVNWKKLLNQKFKLKDYEIEFNNYMTDIYMYTVIMIAHNKNGKQICDSFSSSKNEYVDPDTLLNNIISFLKFADT